MIRLAPRGGRAWLLRACVHQQQRGGRSAPTHYYHVSNDRSGTSAHSYDTSMLLRGDGGWS